jgi:hypothetical protein
MKPGHAARKAWLAYAGILTFAVVVGELSNLARGRAITMLTAANWAVTLALLAATWGYALQRPVATPLYWRRVFWILLFASSLMLLRVALASASALVVVLAFMVLLVPAYVAAYLYAFRSARLWEPEALRSTADGNRR